MRAFRAPSSSVSPSWKSMARLALPSRLELKRPEGSFREAPLAKVIFTTFLYVSPVKISPLCDLDWSPSPLPLLGHFGVCLLDQGAEPGEHLAPPVAQILDSSVYELRWRLGFLRPALLHVTCLSLGRFSPLPCGAAEPRESLADSGLVSRRTGNCSPPPYRKR